MKKAIITALAIMAITLSAKSQTELWEKLNTRPYPQWFSDARLGIFVHWGLYSVPAYAGKEGYAEWLYRGLMLHDARRLRSVSYYADTTLPVREMYAQLVDHWHAEMWNPDEWAQMFKDAGAKYVMLVTKHHDGYCLWDSPYQPEWNSTMSGPHRNIVEELTNSVRNAGMRMCFYYSLPEWSNPLHVWMQDPDENISKYVDQYMIPQFKELVNRYHPDAIFADGDWQNTPEQLRSAELIDWYYKTVGSDAIVNDRWGKGTPHGFRTPEYSAGISLTDRPWAECRGIGRSFGLNRNEDLDNYLTDRELIQHFCELVAHGGGLTLNIAPSADGHIPFIQQERLRAIGHWLAVNGEAIYGSAEPANKYATLVVQRTVQQAPISATKLNFNWVRNAPLKGMPVDDFDITWHGVATAPAEGYYTLRLEADEEATVIRAGHKADTLLYYNHGWADNSRSTAKVYLKQGEHLPLEVIYHERDLEATLSLTWSLDDGATFQPIEARWEGTAQWQHTNRCFTSRGNNLYIIEFERPGNTLCIPDMPALWRNATITLLGTSAKLKWKQSRNGNLTIDLSNIDHTQLNALEHAWVFRVSE